MKRIPVDECPAGPWLDAVVAMVLGWKLVEEEDFESGLGKFHFLRFFDGCRYRCRYRDVLIKGKLSSPDNAFHPSRNIAAAWELVEEAKKDCWADFIDDLEWKADSSSTFDVLRFVAPLTITRAFLKAKGIEFVEIPEELCDD